MVTGDKPDEQADWSEVVAVGEALTEVGEALGNHIARIQTPLRDLLDSFSTSLFGVPMNELPEWVGELWELESQHSQFGLRGRARRRLASLRKRDRRWYRLLGRVVQRRAMGVRDV